MKNKTLLVLNIFAIIVGAVVLTQQIVFAKEPDARLLCKAGVVFLTYFIAVRRYLKQQKNKHAIECFPKYRWLIADAFSSAPKVLDALKHATQLISTEKHDKALKILERLDNECQTIRDESALRLLKTLCFFGIKNYRAAMFSLETVTEKDPQNANAWAFLSLLQLRFSFGNLALESIEHAIDLDNKNPVVHTCKAILYYYMDEFGNAINKATDALKLDDKATIAFLVLALSYHHLGNRTQSLYYIQLFEQSGGNVKKLTKHLSALIASRKKH